MKVCIHSLTGELDALRDKVEQEGDQLVRLQDEPELVLTDDPTISGDNVVSFGLSLPSVALQAAGFSQVMPHASRDHALVRWYTAGVGWLDQTILVIPLLTLFNWDLGGECPSGCVLKFLHSPSINALFENVMISQVLTELKHTGFVTLWRGRNGSMISLETGFPHYGLYALCEGIRGKLSKWFSEPEPVLESWMCSNLVSRWPYPHKLRDERVEVACRNGAFRHLWLFEPLAGRKNLFVEQTRVGVITAWNHSLRDSAARVLGDCWNLELPRKQFRTDLVEKALDTVARLESEGAI